MHTLTIQIKDTKALKAIHSLQQKNSLQIVEDIIIESPSLQGRSLSVSAFKTWIEAAETAPSVTLKSAKSQWLKKRARLNKLTL
jgi:hypothetical protein